MSISVVWIDMLKTDNALMARRAAACFPSDPRVRQFYDSEKRTGKAIARALGAQEGAVAWDIYLFYPAGCEWTHAAPTSVDWMHQLASSKWADLARYRSGDDLLSELARTMQRLAGC